MREALSLLPSVAAVAVASLLARAAWLKHRDPAAFLAALRAYRLLPERACPALALGLPWVEAALALLLCAGFTRRPAEFGAALLFAVFAAAMLINLARGRTQIDCGCGDPRSPQPIGLGKACRALGIAVVMLAAARPPRGFGDLLLFSSVLQWSLIAAVAAAAWGLAGRIGALQSRVPPLGALAIAGGPAAGAVAPRMKAALLAGGTVTVGGAFPRATLLLFVAAGCPLSRKLLPIARRVARAEHLRLILAGDAPEAEQRALVDRHRLQGVPFVNGPQTGLAYGIGQLPHAVLIDPAGRIAGRGLVNSREHLESLVNAAATGTPTLQHHLRARADGAAYGRTTTLPMPARSSSAPAVP